MTPAPPPPQRSRRRLLGFLLRLTISGVALYFVYSKIDFDEAVRTLRRVHLGYFLLAVLTFNGSKVLAALRFRAFLVPLGLRIGHAYNLRLLYISMFYNLFLPGSVSGDAYKVYLLRQHHGAPVKALASAALLDRLSGLVLLVVIGGVFLTFSSFTAVPWADPLALAGAALALPAFWLGVRLLFRRFASAFSITSLYSLGVQSTQVLCAFWLLLSLSVTGYHLDYLTLFLISSVVAVLPFTIGGVGARELVFLYGVQYLRIEEEKAVTFAILFFLVTAIASLGGAFLKSSEGDKGDNTN